MEISLLGMEYSDSLFQILSAFIIRYTAPSQVTLILFDIRSQVPIGPNSALTTPSFPRRGIMNDNIPRYSFVISIVYIIIVDTLIYHALLLGTCIWRLLCVSIP